MGSRRSSLDADQRVLFLGASHIQTPPIRYSKLMGYSTYTVDNRSDNPGHLLADKSFNISTKDVSAIADLARGLGITGLVAYASDTAALTAAEVTKQLNLPGQNLEAVRLMTNKDKWRDFLRSKGFNVPKSFSVSDATEIAKLVQQHEFPMLLKPVDSSGSKGISKLTRKTKITEIEEAVSSALSHSMRQQLILEQLIIKDGPQVAGDGFVLGGELVHVVWGDENFDDCVNGLVPAGQTFPSTQSRERLEYAQCEFNRLIKLLGLQSGPLNFDFIFDQNGNLFILELGPRNGGCRIPEVAKLATGVDMISATVELSLGREIAGIHEAQISGFWGTFMFHSQSAGTYRGLNIHREVASSIVDMEVWVSAGDQVKPFMGGDNAVGSALLRFEDKSIAREVISQLNGSLELN